MADGEISAHLGAGKHERDYGVVTAKSKDSGVLSLGRDADCATECLCGFALQFTSGK